MRKTWMLIGISVLAIGGFLIMKPAGKSEHMSFVYADKGPVIQVVTGSGQIQPINVVRVGTQVSGIIEKIYVDYNDEVKENQLLAKLDTAILDEEMKEREADYALAESKLKIARLNYNRLKKLYTEKLISKAEFEEAEITLETAKAQLQAADVNKSKTARYLNYARIISPVSGTIISKEVESGQTVAASYQTPTLFQVAEDLSKMQIEASISEADIGSLKTGMPVSFTVDAYPLDSFRGEVYQIRLNPVEEQNVIMYTVVIRFDNKDKKLLPGMTAFVKITTQQKENVRRLSNTALQFYLPKELKKRLTADKNIKSLKENQAVIYTPDGEMIRPVIVEKGISDTEYTEILTDLSDKMPVLAEYYTDEDKE